ncbi:MAG: tripartite tricarboxylate transporter substrate binding protein [Betaproteobacteria bacterium]|nr:tripartite tricarboxylate transporter substrate binding protein [Betaproteobacteria bacterium]
MKLPRRQFLQFAGAIAIAPALSKNTSALDYPSRPVRIVVGFPPAATSDIVARLMGQWLSDRLGKSFIVENRPGVAGNIGTEAVVRASPDGYTLLLVGPAAMSNVTLYNKSNFNFLRDITPVASIIRVPGVMVVHPSFPAKTIPEFIAYAKANPDKVNMASAGIGSVPHVSGELFNMLTGIKMVHVPYRGTPLALTDLLSGQVQVMFGVLPSSIEFIRSGQLRALAVTSVMRSEALPDIPAVRDFVPGYEASAVYGLGAPIGTPAEIIDKLNKAINAGLADPKLKSLLANLGGVVLAEPPAEFGKLMADETEKWAKVVKFADIKAE